MIAIIGAGGFAREVKAQIEDTYESISINFFVNAEYLVEDSLPIEELDTRKYEVIVAIADPHVRKRIVESLPESTRYYTFIHKSAVVLSKNVGIGSIICANATITTNVSIGRHVHINPSVTVGHDTVVGDYFTATPGVNIAGNCRIGNNVYFGTNSCIRQKTTVASDVVIGMGSVVLKDIDKSGTYVGSPCRRLK